MKKNLPHEKDLLPKHSRILKGSEDKASTKNYFLLGVFFGLPLAWVALIGKGPSTGLGGYTSLQVFAYALSMFCIPFFFSSLYHLVGWVRTGGKNIPNPSYFKKWHEKLDRLDKGDLFDMLESDRYTYQTKEDIKYHLTLRGVFIPKKKEETKESELKQGEDTSELEKGLFDTIKIAKEKGLPKTIVVKDPPNIEPRLFNDAPAPQEKTGR